LAPKGSVPFLIHGMYRGAHQKLAQQLDALSASLAYRPLDSKAPQTIDWYGILTLEYYY